MSKTVATVHLDVRISVELHSMLMRAAELQGCTMTDFVVDAVQDAVQRIIERADVMPLSIADRDQVVRHCFRRLSQLQPCNALLSIAASFSAWNEMRLCR